MHTIAFITPVTFVTGPMTDPITLFLEDIKEKDKDVVLEA
jgi:hypothetical protein